MRRRSSLTSAVVLGLAFALAPAAFAQDRGFEGFFERLRSLLGFGGWAEVGGEWGREASGGGMDSMTLPDGSALDPWGREASSRDPESLALPDGGNMDPWGRSLPTGSGALPPPAATATADSPNS
jgi:hypothetical protein